MHNLVPIGAVSFLGAAGLFFLQGWIAILALVPMVALVIWHAVRRARLLPPG